MESKKFLIYLIAMAGITYMTRTIPLLLIRKKITNKFVLSFLHYVPYAVLSAMTVPAIFYATTSPVTAIAGFAVAVIMAFFGKTLLTVAAASCATVFIVQLILSSGIF